MGSGLGAKAASNHFFLIFFGICPTWQVDLPPTASGSFFYGFNDIILRSRGDGSPSGPGLFKLSLTSNGASVSPFSLPGIDRNRHVEAVSVGWQHTLALVK